MGTNGVTQFSRRLSKTKSYDWGWKGRRSGSIAIKSLLFWFQRTHNFYSRHTSTIPSWRLQLVQQTSVLDLALATCWVWSLPGTTVGEAFFEFRELDKGSWSMNLIVRQIIQETTSAMRKLATNVCLRLEPIYDEAEKSQMIQCGAAMKL